MWLHCAALVKPALFGWSSYIPLLLELLKPDVRQPNVLYLSLIIGLRSTRTRTNLSLRHYLPLHCFTYTRNYGPRRLLAEEHVPKDTQENCQSNCPDYLIAVSAILFRLDAEG